MNNLRADGGGDSGYDPDAADSAVRLARLVGDRRTWHIVRTLFLFLSSLIIETILPPRGLAPQAINRRRAARIRGLLTELGPTYIKVGQFLSARRDLLPEPVSDELARLQDSVPPFAADIARRVIACELGRDPDQLFAVFEEAPVASASIGQVHRVRLKDGRAAIVKVQRPGLRRMIYQDLGYMRLCARLSGFFGRGDASRWLALADEFGRTLFAECDYLEEGKNADRLRRVLRHYPAARVPRVHWSFTRRRVITLEYISGVKVSDVPALQTMGVDLRALANRLIDCYLEQVVSGGFFHADPHPGNLAVDESGNLVIYDFGMMGRISETERAAIACLVSAVYRRDARELAICLVRLGVVKGEEFVEPVSRALAPVIAYYGGKDILSLDFQRIEADLDSILADRAIQMPPTLAYLVRTASSLEGVARTLRPNFSFARAARPFLARWAVERGFIELETALQEIFQVAAPAAG